MCMRRTLGFRVRLSKGAAACGPWGRTPRLPPRNATRSTVRARADMAARALPRSLLDKGLEDKVKMSKDGPSQLKRLEREVEMARLAVKEAREKAAAPAH